MNRGLLGAVLAGGEGRRMGTRKEEVFLRGRPLWAFSWNALAPVTEGPVLLQGAERAPDGLEPSADQRRGEGPLGGLETLLGRARDDGRPGVVVAAVDLPRVPASLIVALVRRWRSLAAPEGRAVVLRDGDRIQPLVGVYGAELGGHLTSWLDGGTQRAVHAWIGSLGERVERPSPEALEGAVGHAEPLLNLNRPDELRDAARLPHPAPPMVSVVGWKNSGKTTTAATLVRCLRQRGWRVMALKHGHHFRLDREGTDSSRLRAEGAERVCLAGPEGFGLLGGWGQAELAGAGDGSAGFEPSAVELAARYLAEADLVVVEGWKGAPLPAIEVRNPSASDDPPLWDPDGVDRDRFLARVAPGGSIQDRGAGSPPVLDREGTELGDRLAELVESRVIPGWRA